MPEHPDEPSNKFLQFLNMGSISSWKHAMEFWWYGIIETLNLWDFETKKPRNLFIFNWGNPHHPSTPLPSTPPGLLPTPARGTRISLFDGKMQGDFKTEWSQTSFFVPALENTRWIFLILGGKGLGFPNETNMFSYKWQEQRYWPNNALV